MSREIKFRAWLENTERPGSNEGMVFGYDRESYKNFLDDIINKYPHRQGQLINQKGICTPEGYVYRLHQFFNLSWLGNIHLMQYTGLKDKNGKEIYEDDILFVDDNYDKFGWASGMRGKVIFDKGKFWLSENSGYKFYFEDNEMNYVEVIGNIHQNPELLKP